MQGSPADDPTGLVVTASELEWFPVEIGHVLMFARAIGDHAVDDAVLTDGLPAAQAPVPLTFLQAAEQFDPESKLRPRGDRPWIGNADTSADPNSSGGRFHAEQHLELIRPLRVGDVLTVSTRPGNSWEKSGRRGGRLFLSEIIKEYRDAAGELVARSRSVGLAAERVVDPITP